MQKPAAADASILAALERGIPLEPKPFARIAEGLGMDEPALLAATNALIDKGAIRRLAVSFDSRKLGFASTLVAAETKRDREAAAIALVNSFDEVTHHYLRAGSNFDLWFTLVASTRARIAEVLRELEASGLFEYIIELPATKVFKVDVRFGPQAQEARP
jgi:siroheme decarboxylase